MKTIASFMLGAAAGLSLGCWLQGRAPAAPAPAPRVDTVYVAQPPARDTVYVEKRAARLPAVHTRDTVLVEVPIAQVHYADTLCEAWVSGYEPRLDSLRLFIPAPEPPRPKRWHAGLSAGCAITPRGAEPYIGIGITYSFISF